jgi:Reverse transcriptase (RNA-dependent DNA polymerase)/Endonuclease-reverse transcriptase
MNFLQINLNHCETAQDLLRQAIYEMKADVVLISEPYFVPNNNAWLSDDTGKAAIWTCSDFPIQQTDERKNKGYTHGKINGIHIFSCYAPPSITIEEYEEMLNHLVDEARSLHPVVIAGDFNAWAEDWGSRVTNRRGQLLLEIFSQLDVVLVNNVTQSTFNRNGRESTIDITFVSGSLARNCNWNVSDRYTHSDHKLVVFDIGTKPTRQRYQAVRNQWAVNKFDEDLFREMFSNEVLIHGSASEKVNGLCNKLTRACDASMPRKRISDDRKPAYWWNPEIAVLRSRCLQARRRYQRTLNCPENARLQQEFRDARKILRNEIRQSKREGYKRLCQEADANPWGAAYKMVMSRIRGNRTPQEKCPVVLKTIISSLFPCHPARPEQNWNEDGAEIPAITVEEVLTAAKKIGTKKASGPDMIPNIALKVSVSCNPELVVGVLQSCLDGGIFPNIWKRQKLVLLPKPGKPPGIPSSYRPICLLDSMGKILERIIQNRLLPYTEGNDGLSDNQFGFRKARSTMDAIDTVINIARDAVNRPRGSKQYCAVVTLDVQNAFNSANWDRIMTALEQMEVPNYLIRIVDNYLNGRVLIYDTEEGPKEYMVTAGVPQGSVLGPILWNIMYNGIFKLDLPREAKIIGFADDVALVIAAKELEEVELIGNEAIKLTKDWIESAGLNIAEHKTEILLVSSRRKIEALKLKVGKHVITSKRTIKYLGIMIDDKLSFRSHLEYMCTKASNINVALSRMLPNVGGPRSSRRILLASVVSSVLLYGAPVWAEVLSKNSNRRLLERVQRLSALRVISSFRTTSGDAALVIAGMLPIDLVAQEAKKTYFGKKTNQTVESAAQRAESIRQWQDRWDNSTKGRWTYRLIPNIEIWTKRKHGEVNYHLTQFLTGHGGYRAYLHRFGHEDSPRCQVCTTADESPEHVLFECTRFKIERTEMCDVIGTVNPDNIIENMLSSKEKWNAVITALVKIHSKLRKDEADRNTLRASSIT